MMGTRAEVPCPHLIPAVPVPFDADGELDEKGLEPLFGLLDDAGVDGVFVSGTTGEFPALDDAERDVVLTEALAVFGPERVYAHVGAASARQAERLAAHAVALGATKLAAITPYYLPAGPRALVDHYRRIAAAAGDARLFVYLYPARTTTTVTPEQLAELATIPGVAGVKISGEPTARVVEYLRAVPAGFAVYSGNDVTFAAVVRAGGGGRGLRGVERVPASRSSSSATPCAAADDQAAATAQARVEQAVAAVGGNVALIKAALAQRGLPAGPTRMALDPPSPAQVDAIRAANRDLA